MATCNEVKYSEEDAKNTAVLKTRSLRMKRSKLGTNLPHAKAYKCKICTSWHVKTLSPKETETQNICQELSYTPS